MDSNAQKFSLLFTVLAILIHALRYAVPGGLLFQSVPSLARVCVMAIKIYCLINHTVNKRFISSGHGADTHARSLPSRMRSPLRLHCHYQVRPANLHSYSIADQTP
ncbi:MULTISPECIES: hypothetical protein [unclassified Pseudomonas]|jgi:hypothetical protein|uniref:hypothetical protein n=1 Tax=unclassified Pseudomonas TaxID=196821 RepID=UPI0011AF8CF8|nr:MULTISPECIES: hypothetical protein [unclassified Pseudomonas]